VLYRAVLPLGLLAVIYSLPFAASSYAQLPQLPKRCSPPPTEVPGSVASSDAPQRRVIIEGVIFDAPTHLPDSVIAQAVAKANGNDWTTGNARWVDEFAEIGLSGAWQDRGYNHVQVAAEAKSIGGDSSEETFLVIAHVAEGLQYHLGDLQFVSVGPSEVPHFSESELRSVFPLREGELFNASLIRQGIEELTKLYWAQGYLDFTATPKIMTDENLQRVSLVFDLDEQKQFRVGSFEIVGLDPGLEARLRAVIRPGEMLPAITTPRC
jgi:outer membrane protein assembly factor BamA